MLSFTHQVTHPVQPAEKAIQAPHHAEVLESLGQSTRHSFTSPKAARNWANRSRALYDRLRSVFCCLKSDERVDQSSCSSAHASVGTDLHLRTDPALLIPQTLNAPISCKTLRLSRTDSESHRASSVDTRPTARSTSCLEWPSDFPHSDRISPADYRSSSSQHLLRFLQIADRRSISAIPLRSLGESIRVATNAITEIQSGMLPIHIERLCLLASAVGIAFAVRPVSSAATHLIAQGYPTKGISIKLKSASEGPQQGHLCPLKSSFARPTKRSSSSQTEPTVMLDLEDHGKASYFTKELDLPALVQLAQADTNKQLVWLSLKVSEAQFKHIQATESWLPITLLPQHLAEFKLKNPEIDMTNVNLFQGKHSAFSEVYVVLPAKPYQGIAQADEPWYQVFQLRKDFSLTPIPVLGNKHKQLPITADYDLLTYTVPVEHEAEQGLDSPVLPAKSLEQVMDSRQRLRSMLTGHSPGSAILKELGNHADIEKCLIKHLNRAIGRGADLEMFHHASECHNLQSNFDRSLPAVFFQPVTQYREEAISRLSHLMPLQVIHEAIDELTPLHTQWPSHLCQLDIPGSEVALIIKTPSHLAIVDYAISAHAKLKSSPIWPVGLNDETREAIRKHTPRTSEFGQSCLE